MDPLIPYQCEAIHLFLSRLRTDISRAEPMNLSMFSHEFLAILVVCTLGGWAPVMEFTLLSNSSNSCIRRY